MNNKYINKFLLLGIITISIIFIPRTFPIEINPWVLMNWNITFETGFVLRGLVGSISTLFVSCIKSNHLLFIGLINTIIYSTLLIIFMCIAYKRIPKMNMFIFIVLFAVQPFITQWYMTSTIFQRLDVLLNIIFIISLIIIIKCDKPIIYPIVLILSILCLLIHEGYAVYSIPTITSLLIYKSISKSNDVNTKSKWYKPLLYYMIPIIIIYLVIITLGKPALSLEDFRGLIDRRMLEVRVSDNDIYSIFYMPISEKIPYTLASYKSTRLINLFATILLMSPSIIVVSCIWKTIFKNSNKKEKYSILFVIICSFSTVVAFFLAVDIMRWLGYIVFNNMFGLFAIILMNDKYSLAITNQLDKIKHLMVAAIVLALVLGPTQWMNGFAIINKVLLILANYLGIVF